MDLSNTVSVLGNYNNIPTEISSEAVVWLDTKISL